MNWTDATIIDIFVFLLPGFIVAWVFHGLTPFPKPSQFERIIQALIFTIVVQAIVVVMQRTFLMVGGKLALGPWTENVALVWSVLVAGCLGLGFARLANNDALHGLLRRFKFTSLTSYPSEWFAQFNENETYVVLHLDGNRRLYGWPVQWPSDRSEGDFVIAEAEWLVEGDRIPLKGVESVLISVGEVEFIEFMELRDADWQEPTQDEHKGAEPSPFQEGEK